VATRIGTRSDWLRRNPPEPARLTATLAGVADRARVGEDFRHAVRDFLDEVALRSRDDQRAALAFDERRSTRAIDAVFEPKAIVYEVAAGVAEDSACRPAG
jgi:hypothetical protein